MKLSRTKLRRLIESVINEQEAGDYGTGPVFSQQKLTQFDKLIKDYAYDLQIAMHGIGHDRTVIGKINKTLTGLGTDEGKIYSVFREIVELSSSELARHYQKFGRSPEELDYGIIDAEGKGILQLVGLKYKHIAGESLIGSLESELSEGELSTLKTIIDYEDALRSL